MDEDGQTGRAKILKRIRDTDTIIQTSKLNDRSALHSQRAFFVFSMVLKGTV
jgi:hypothetical protein